MSNESIALLIALGTLAVAESQAITLGFTSLDDANAKLVFDGPNNTFSFGNVLSGEGAGYSFSISESDGLGDSLGLFGTITGTFNIGAVSNGEAPVSGVGQVVIEGGFLANVSFNNLFKTRATGGIEGEFNLSNITYAGSNADLLALAAGAPGQANLSFTISGKTLAQIVDSSTKTYTSYDGEFFGEAPTSVPDGGATALLLGLGLLGFAGVRRLKA
jgi:hypothetical protein